MDWPPQQTHKSDFSRNPPISLFLSQGEAVVCYIKTVNAEKQFINTHQEAFLPSKLIVSEKIRQQGGGACLRWQDNNEMLM